MEMEGGMSGCRDVKYGIFQNEPSRAIRLSSHKKKTIKSIQTQGNEYVQWIIIIMFEFGISIICTFFCQ